MQFFSIKSLPVSPSSEEYLTYLFALLYSLALVPSPDDIIASANASITAVIAAIFIASSVTSLPPQAFADTGASTAANAKITTGGASTLQSGRTIAITRGVNLDRSDFGGQNLKGVAFQQSIVRDTNFKGTNLVGSSFFDATVDGSDFEGAGKLVVYEGPSILWCFIF